MNDLHLHRVLKAPRSAVWACWTDPRHIPHWFAPKPVETVVRALDLRPGGAFGIEMFMDGASLGADEPGCFLEVVPEERLTWTSALGPDFRPVDRSAAPFVFTATITLADHPDGTDYRVVARHKDQASADAHETMGFSQGWGTVAEQLGAYAAGLGTQAPDDRTLVIERSFRAAPDLVYAAWTHPLALTRWFGPEGWTCETEAMDLRVGGEWRFTMKGEGLEFPNRHRWTELTPPEGAAPGRIAFLMDGVDGRAPKEVTVTISAEGAGTRLRQVMVFPDAGDLALARSYGAEAKGQETLAKLAASLGE
jgi:uncharacterized protein YndB with AHSA1/START domain